MGWTPSRAATIVGLVAVTVLGTACQNHASRAAPAATPTAFTGCVNTVSYWVSRQVAARTDNGLDYQEMGMSDGEYEIYLAVIRRHSPAAARFMNDSDLSRIRGLCAARSARTQTPGTKGYGWPG